MNDRKQLRLFPPRDMISTSLVWGFWAAGLMASLNYARMGDKNRGVRLMALVMAAQLALWIVELILIPRFNIWSVVAIVGWFFANLSVGYAICRLQTADYRRWLQAQPVLINPYVSPWVSLLAVVGVVTIMVIVCVLVNRFS